MIVRRFDDVSAMEQEAVALLKQHFGLSCPGPHAVMLTGGRTPLGLYKRVEESPGRIDDRLHLLISDERHVGEDSPDHNFAAVRPMIDAMGIDDSRVMRVDTRLSLGAAADRYDRDLGVFLERGGRITLGILGLGADGHVASLFGRRDVAAAAGRYAVAVRRSDGPDRVSATRDLLLKVERPVLFVAGPAKAQVVDKMASDPASVTAGQVFQDAAGVELWYCPAT